MKQSEIEKKYQWHIIEPKSLQLNINLFELWNFRDLIFLFVKRDFVAIYKQTILGPIWYLLQPLFSTLVFTIIFGEIAKIPTDGLPPILFYMTGIISWSYFSGCLTKTSDTFIANAGIFGKVYFPRLVIPISVTISTLISFLIQFALLACFLFFFYLKGVSIKLNSTVFLLPLLVLQMAVLGLGTGILISSLTTKYRDLVFAVGFGTQLWMYATPVVYPLSQVPEKWQWVLAINPMTSIVETFRHAILGSGTSEPWMFGLSIGMTLLILLVGLILFRRTEKTFMDTA